MTSFNEPGGFRLARLELFNWGTFDGEVWTMKPQAKTAVLTGANGSGKSTLVDALLTLLVENRRRNYNLASGSGKSQERTEQTYVRGQYSRSRGENTVDARPNTLRGPESHSVLLAAFEDAAQERTVTLAVILWISNAGRVEKRYYLAPFDLSIQEHFPQRHITARDLPEGVETFGNVFKEYIAAARKALGLGGRPKALDLFNETVSVKEIASLNTFVREHMLDKGNPLAKVEALRNQYRELNDAHSAIQRAAHQLDILAPLVEAGREYRRYEDLIARYNQAKSLVPFYAADRARERLAEAIAGLQTPLQTQQSRLEKSLAELETLRARLSQVEIAIAQDSVGQMKREIENLLPLLRQNISTLKAAAKQYDDAARRLGLATYHTEDDFYNNREAAETIMQDAQTTISELDSQRGEAQIQQRDIIKQGEALDTEIEHLRQNPSNIPAHVARIRQDICAALDIDPAKLPFAGELLRVRDEDAAWEGALERVLHGFAQNLIVPEDLYTEISAYINANHLGGRLVYQRVDPTKTIEQGGKRQQGAMAYDKLLIQPNTPYYDWLAGTLRQRFDYVCCDTLADFQAERRAITPQGQIKHSPAHHEKDDRRNLMDRRHYVLGWDNRDKLRALEDELVRLQRDLDALEERIARLNDDLERARRDRTAAEALLNVADFADIDWHTYQAKLDQNEAELARLNKEASQLRDLERQRETLKKDIQEAETRRDNIQREITTLENRRDDYQTQLQRAEDQLNAMTVENEDVWHEVIGILEEVDKQPDSTAPLETRISELEVSITRSIGNYSGYQGGASTTILNAMHTFRREYPSEGATLTADVEALKNYEQIHERLASDDLPRHEQRFKDLLDRAVTRGVMAFYTTLNEQERAIDRSIAELNESLAQVDYGRGSIIRLIAEPTGDHEINDFKRELRACIPDAGDDSPEELERAYKRIKALIERFDNDPNWMGRVIDVRRWRTFAAEQINEQGEQIDYYNDSSGKSGGQKAKLAYTILASAIAHQYGLQEAIGADRTFRFVVIDEAFSKLDDDNARFAMKLFAQLGLQLLVVTPMQQLHIIEDFVEMYHMVDNTSEGDYSRLFNLSQADYQTRRREFQAQAGRA